MRNNSICLNLGKLIKNKYPKRTNDIIVNAFKAGPSTDSIPINEKAKIKLNAKKNSLVLSKLDLANILLST